MATDIPLKAGIVVCIFALCGLSGPAEGRTHHYRRELYQPTPIPDGYRSWSLFLVCNPGWIAQNGDKGIDDLYAKFQAFGDSIGDDNIAIWFWKKRSNRLTVENTDVERSARYCRKYRLKPSEGPHILVTKQHPDGPVPDNDKVVVKFNGLNAQKSADALAKLADGLHNPNADQTDNDTWWWQHIPAAAKSVACYFNKVTFSVNVGVFKGEIAHSGDGC